MKLVRNKVIKPVTNTVQATLGNVIEDRATIKHILIITLSKDGVYRLNSSYMSNEQVIAMCECAKQRALNRMFGEEP